MKTNSLDAKKKDVFSVCFIKKCLGYHTKYKYIHIRNEQRMEIGRSSRLVSFFPDFIISYVLRQHPVSENLIDWVTLLYRGHGHYISIHCYTMIKFEVSKPLHVSVDAH